MSGGPNNAHLEKRSIWYKGLIPTRNDMLDVWNAISEAIQRDHNRLINGAGCPLKTPVITLPGSFAVNVAAGGAITPTGYSLDWITALSFDASQASHGATLGVPSIGSGEKRYIVCAAAHVFTDNTAATDKDGNTVYVKSLSQVELRTYMVAANVAAADTWSTNAALTALIATIRAADAVPLVICEKYNGTTDYSSSQVHAFDRVVAAAGSLGVEAEEMRRFVAWNSAGKVLGASGTIASSAVTTPGQPGGVTLTGGEELALALLPRGTSDLYRRLQIRSATVPNTTITLGATSTRYIIRAKFDEEGALSIYTTTTTVSYPDLSQTPGPLATSSEGSGSGAFLSTCADIALLEVLTGAAGSTPTITAINNHALAAINYLTEEAFLNGGALTATTGDFSSNVQIDGALTVDGSVTVGDTLNVSGEMGALEIFTADINSDGSALAVGGALNAAADVTVGDDLAVADQVIIGSATPGDAQSGYHLTLYPKTTGGTANVAHISRDTAPGASDNLGEASAFHGSVTSFNGKRGRLWWRANGTQGGVSLNAEVAADGAAALGSTQRPTWSVFEWGGRFFGAFAGAATNVVQQVIGRQTDSAGSGAPDVGFGAILEFLLQGSGGSNSSIGRIIGRYATGGDGQVDVYAWDDGGSAFVKAAQFDGDAKIKSPVTAWAWASIANSGTAAIRDSGAAQFNVSSINQTGVGVVQVLLSRGVSDTDRTSVQVTPRSADVSCYVTWDSTTQFTVRTRDINSPAATDAAFDVTVIALES